MKLSRYNIEKKEDKSCLIYNTVTSAILELDTDYEKSYYEMKELKKGESLWIERRKRMWEKYTY